VGIPGTYRERRAFFYYRNETGHKLAVALNQGVVHQVVLQTSHTNPAIRHAAVALGSIGERFAINETTTETNLQANQQHELACLHYCKAIEHLRRQMVYLDDGAVDFVVILSFMFLVFEFLRGNDEAALAHLRSGLGIIKHCYFKKTSAVSSALPRNMADASPLRHALVRIFSVLDIQATLWLCLPTFQNVQMLPFEEQWPRPASFDSFLGLDEASQVINYWLNQIFTFRRLLDHSDGFEQSHATDPTALATQQRLFFEIGKWPQALEKCLSSIPREITIDETHRVALMRIYFEFNTILISTCLAPTEASAYASLTSSFSQIVILAKGVLRHNGAMDKTRVLAVVKANTQELGEIPIFAFCFGFIHPLSFTAVKCQDRGICEEALKLLRDKPWREGAWDSAVMARIAWRRRQEWDGSTVI